MPLTQIVQYIAQSIDIIINMKGGDETPRSTTSHPLLSCSSLGSVGSQNLIMQSMKEAVYALNEKNQRYKEQGTNPYEKMVQKLESDVRGHIKLEHEMKIHMDYLEHKLEQYQMRDQTIEDEVDNLQGQLETAQDKLRMVKEAKQREAKDLNRKLDESRQQNKNLQ